MFRQLLQDAMGQEAPELKEDEVEEADVTDESSDEEDNEEISKEGENSGASSSAEDTGDDGEGDQRNMSLHQTALMNLVSEKKPMERKRKARTWSDVSENSIAPVRRRKRPKKRALPRKPLSPEVAKMLGEANMLFVEKKHQETIVLLKESLEWREI